MTPLIRNLALLVVASVSIMLSSCSSPPEVEYEVHWDGVGPVPEALLLKHSGGAVTSTAGRVEEYLPVEDVYIYWDGTEDVRTGLLCKKNDDGTASVAIIVRNRSNMDVKLLGKPVLRVDGTAQKEEVVSPGKQRVLVPGKDFIYRFDTVFPSYNVKSKDNNKGYPMMVSARAGTYQTPIVIIHMPVDNMLPFRFARPLD